MCPPPSFVRGGMLFSASLACYCRSPCKTDPLPRAVVDVRALAVPVRPCVAASHLLPAPCRNLGYVAALMGECMGGFATAWGRPPVRGWSS